MSGLVAVTAAGATLPMRSARAYTTVNRPFEYSSIYVEPENNKTPMPAWMIKYVQSTAQNWTNTSTSLTVHALTGHSGTAWYVGYYVDNSGSMGSSMGLGGCSTEVYDNNQYWCAHAVLYINTTPNSSSAMPDDPTIGNHVIGQEMGHAFGLGHTCTQHQIMTGPTGNCGQYEDCGPDYCITTPQQDDVNGINALYPYNASGGGACEQSGGPIRVGSVPQPTNLPDPSSMTSSPLTAPLTNGQAVPYAESQVPVVRAPSDEPPDEAVNNNGGTVEGNVAWWLENWATAPTLALDTASKAVTVQVSGAQAAC